MLNVFIGFVVGSALAVFSHWLVLRRDRQARLKEREMELYLQLLDGISEILEFAELTHQIAIRKSETGVLGADEELAKRAAEMLRKSHRLMLQFYFMGSTDVGQSFAKFIKYCEDTETFDYQTAFRMAGHIGYAMCCDIHGEPYEEQNDEMCFESYTTPEESCKG